MGKSSAAKDIDQEVASMTLDELNAQISRALYYWRNGGTSQGRRGFFKRLVALESQKELLLNIPAPQRRYNR